MATPHSSGTVTPVTELGEFLRSRRDRISPDDAGINSYGRRRVPGLRREELARLAGVSVTYLTRLEQGLSQNASDAIIDALARALRLDEDERAHLYALARPTPSKRTRESYSENANPGAVQLLHSMTEVPAVLLGRFNDILGWNRAGHLLLAGHLDGLAPTRPDDRPNQLKLLFLDDHVRDLYIDWVEEAALAVSSLRYVAAKYAKDPSLAGLIGELSMHSPEFARLWAGHDVRLCTSGTKRLRHPEVGELTLNYKALHLPEGNGQRLLTHTAEPASPSSAAIRLLTMMSSVST